MATLEQLTQGKQIRGILPEQIVTLIAVQPHGANAVEVVFRHSDGTLGQQLLYRENEAQLELVEAERLWAFDVDGGLLRLVSEAYRIHLAHLFDPVLAVHTSMIDPLPASDHRRLRRDADPSTAALPAGGRSRRW